MTGQDILNILIQFDTYALSLPLILDTGLNDFIAYDDIPVKAEVKIQNEEPSLVIYLDERR